MSGWKAPPLPCPVPRLVLPLLVALALVAPAAGALHDVRQPDMGCDGDSQRPDGCVCPAYTMYVNGRDRGLDAGTGERYYVAVDEVASHGYLFSIWIFREANGRDGLQRHDGYCTDSEFLAVSEEEANRLADESVL